MQQDLVTIGVPVRDGAESLQLAIDSILAQDYQNIELIISDNCSTDNTPVICQRYADLDDRVIYHRQEIPLSAFDNFNYVLGLARGKYFSWAAHDDWRSPNFISLLAKAFEQNREAVLSFGDLYITDDLAKEGEMQRYLFGNDHLSILGRMYQTAHMQCYHIYGLWRTDDLRRIPFYETTWWPDMPIMMAASYLGKFVYVDGVQFRYKEVEKSNLDRANYQNYRSDVDQWRVFRLIWTTYKTCLGVSGIRWSLLGAFFVAIKQIKVAAFVIKREVKYRLQRNILGSTS
jgi:glycosyltransferase involved in cell wall biosynthesis